MTEKKVGRRLHYAAYFALAMVAFIAIYHPLILTLLAIGAGLFFFGRQIELSN